MYTSAENCKITLDAQIYINFNISSTISLFLDGLIFKEMI